MLVGIPMGAAPSDLSKGIEDDPVALGQRALTETIGLERGEA